MHRETNGFSPSLASLGGHNRSEILRPVDAGTLPHRQRWHRTDCAGLWHGHVRDAWGRSGNQLSCLTDHAADICIPQRMALYYVLFDYFRERGKEGEKNQMVASPTPPADDLAGNPALCPDWESNRPALNPLSHTRPGYSTVL